MYPDPKNFKLIKPLFLQKISYTKLTQIFFDFIGIIFFLCQMQDPVTAKLSFCSDWRRIKR